MLLPEHGKQHTPTNLVSQQDNVAGGIGHTSRAQENLSQAVCSVRIEDARRMDHDLVAVLDGL